MKKKLLSIVLVMVMLVALVVPTTAKLVPDDLIATIDVNTGAKYEPDICTILTRIGNFKTIGEVTEYLLGSSPKDYNYFYVYVVEEDGNGAYVVTETYTTLGRDKTDGPKTDVEIPENGFLVCVYAGNEEEWQEKASYIRDNVKIGDLVVLENIDLTELRALEPNYNPIEGVGKVSFYTAREVAEGDLFYGVDVRVQSVAPSVAIKDAQILIKASTDIYANEYVETNNIEVSRVWYSMYYMQRDIPEDEIDNYERYTYNDAEISVYVKPIDDESVYFSTDLMYLCVVTLSAKNGLVFDSDCIVNSDGGFIQSSSSRSYEIAIEVYPEDEVKTVEDVPVELSWFQNMATEHGQAVVTLPEIDGEFMYMYRTSNGDYDPLDFRSPVGSTVGTLTVNTSDFSMLTSNYISVKEQPYVQIILIEREDLVYNKTVKVLGYGAAIFPMYLPYIMVDNLNFGEQVNVTELGSRLIGKYSENIARASFDGWYLDKEGTVPCTTEQDAYAVFDVICDGGFDPDTYFIISTGEYQINSSKVQQVSLTTLRVSFLVPANKVTVSVTHSGTDKGKAYLTDNEDADYMTFIPDENGNILVGVTMEYPSSVYIKSITINGEEWDSKDNPARLRYDGYTTIFNDEENKGSGWIPVTTSSVINVEFAECDIITIDYGDATVNTRNDESRGHSNHTYYAPETVGIRLCDLGYYSKSEPKMMYMYDLNTKPDGTGISARYIFNDGYYWTLNDEYINGEVDHITLYARFTCNAHNDLSSDDTDFWVYYDASAPEGDKAGNQAYRQCQYCGIYQIVKEGRWQTVNIDEVFISTGWDYAEAYEFTISDIIHYPDDGKNPNNVHVDGLTIIAMLISEDGAPVKGQNYIFTMTDETGNIIETYALNTGVDGIIRMGDTFTDFEQYYGGFLPYGTYTYRIELEKNENIWMEITFEITPGKSNIISIKSEPSEDDFLLGDVNNDGVVDDADAYYLLMYTLLGDMYPVNQPVDFNGDGVVDDADAYYLLMHTLLPDMYPLN